MGKVTIINLTRESVQVDVVHAGGKPDRVQVMPRGKIKLREGMIVSASWDAKHPGVLSIIPAPEGIEKVELLAPTLSAADPAPVTVEAPKAAVATPTVTVTTEPKQGDE